MKRLLNDCLKLILILLTSALLGRWYYFITNGFTPIH
jgi:hypothetical protein